MLDHHAARPAARRTAAARCCPRRRSTSSAGSAPTPSAGCSASPSTRTLPARRSTSSTRSRGRARPARRAPRRPGGAPTNRVSRFVLRDNNVVDPASELVLLDDIPPTPATTTPATCTSARTATCTSAIGDGGCDYAGNSGCAGANDAARDLNVLTARSCAITRDRRHPGRQPVRRRRHRAAAAPRRAAAGTLPARPSPRACATRSASPSTPTPPAPASSSTTSARTPGRRSTRASPGADYGWNVREGHCANTGSSRTAAAPPPAG